MNTLKITTLSLTIAMGLLLSSFVLTGTHPVTPAPISRSATLDKNGKEVIKTEVLFDKSTTREDVINTCTFLAREDVALTFELLQIRKTFFGLMGRQRIAYAEGMIELPGGSFQKFKAGGAVAFKSIKITYSKNSAMIEIVE